jgi:hypothetical protein
METRRGAGESVAQVQNHKVLPQRGPEQRLGGCLQLLVPLALALQIRKGGRRLLFEDAFAAPNRPDAAAAAMWK